MKLFEKMEKSEVGGKEVKRRKRSVEKDSSAAEPAHGSECNNQKMVADEPLPSPVTEVKPLEVSSVEMAAVKSDEMESPMVNVVDTKAGVNSVADTVQGNDEPDVVPDTVSELCDRDIKEQSFHDVSDSSLPASPSKRATQKSPKRAELLQRSLEVPEVLEKTPEVKLDADNTDATDDFNTAETDQPTTATAMESKAEISEETPSVKQSECEDVGTESAEDKPKLVTTKIMQTRMTAKNSNDVMKTDVGPETKLGALRSSLKQPSTAKLKFGMYSRKPLASRTELKADERDIESSSDSGDDRKDESGASESESAKKPKPPAVKLA